MVSPVELRLFQEEYQKYILEVIKPTNDELREVFRQWKTPTYWAGHTAEARLPSASPVRRAFSRIKRPESVVDKILRKPEKFPNGLSAKSLREMTDILAGRIVVYFLSNLSLIDYEIRHSKLLEVSLLQPPVAYLPEDTLKSIGLADIKRGTKESGYASIHYLVKFRSSRVREEERPWIELQVRTLVEDVWGEIEHLLGYKPNKRTLFAVRKQFQIISSQLQSIDNHFNFLYEELTRFQKESKFRDADPLNAENFPGVLEELGISCAQREIDALLKLLVSRGICSVRDLCDVGQARTLALIKETYKTYRDKHPSNFEVVAALAAVKGKTVEKDIIDAVKSQIDFLEGWEKLKAGLS